jgi:acetyl-CoA acyltransferase
MEVAVEVIVAGVATSVPAAPGSTAALARAAAEAALVNAGLDVCSVTGVFVGCGAGSLPDPEALAVRLGLRSLGLRPPRAGAPDGEDGRIEHLTGSAAEALHRACGAVDLGIDRVALCIGVDRIEPAWPPPVVLRRRALSARRLLHASGLSEHHLIRVVVKNHRHGARRGIAGLLTPAEILDGEVVEWPLHATMVAGHGLGAAAVVLRAANGHSALSGPRARIRASVLLGGDGEHGGAPAEEAARLAFRAAHIGPEELDCAELHDVTAAAELAAYEELGLVADGQVAELVDSGFTALGGVLPVNPSGGLLCLGERPGSGAIAQIVELSRQLRGEAGPVQVPGARTALAHSGGRPGLHAAEVVALTLLST